MHQCRRSGCPKLMDRPGFCAKHTVNAGRWSQDSKSASARGYGALWRKARRLFLMDNPLCCKCAAPATVVDHITPHGGNQKLFWARSNWQPLCKACHDIKTVREIGIYG